jgi:hypothetical protein
MDILLMRAGHYFDAGNGHCYGATIAHVGDEGGTVNLSCLGEGGDPFPRHEVPVKGTPSLDDTKNSFHLTRDCPWSR